MGKVYLKLAAKIFRMERNSNYFIQKANCNKAVFEKEGRHKLAD